jgi:hypothetical protein
MTNVTKKQEKQAAKKAAKGADKKGNNEPAAAGS